MTDGILKLVGVIAILAVAWHFWKKRKPCCAECAGKSQMKAVPSSSPPKAQARGCSPFACGR